MSKLPLLSLLVFCTVAVAHAASTPQASAVSDESGMTVQKVMPGGNYDRIQVDDSSERDHYCLNIHAFIFKTEDSRVPKLVGETTCMPAARAKAKRANREFQPKLVPANGGNSF